MFTDDCIRNSDNAQTDSFTMKHLHYMEANPLANQTKDKDCKRYSENRKYAKPKRQRNNKCKRISHKRPYDCIALE